MRKPLNTYVASDFVVTPDWCAKDIIDYFSPSGIILELLNI